MAELADALASGASDSNIVQVQPLSRAPPKIPTVCYNIIMFIVKSFTWWYISGWSVFIGKVKNAFKSLTDFFSMNSLIRTLFKPFRQISADSASVDSSLDLKFHMFIDRLVSRIVGFFSRLILLITGCIIIVLGGIISLVLIILWPFIPLTPIAGIVLTLMGVIL